MRPSWLLESSQNALQGFLFLVPTARLELAQLSPLPPQDSVSTNFTTTAVCFARPKKLRNFAFVALSDSLGVYRYSKALPPAFTSPESSLRQRRRVPQPVRAR